MLNRGLSLECRMLAGMFVLMMFGVAAIRRRCSNARHFNFILPFGFPVASLYISVVDNGQLVSHEQGLLRRLNNLPCPKTKMRL